MVCSSAYSILSIDKIEASLKQAPPFLYNNFDTFHEEQK